MESKLGFISLLANTAASILLVSPVYWMANRYKGVQNASVTLLLFPYLFPLHSVNKITVLRVVYEVTGSYDHLHNCTVGLSGPLFALKVRSVL